MQFLLPGENRCLHRCEAGQRTMARARPILCWPLHRNSSCGHRTHFCTFAIRKATSPTMKMSQQAIPPLPPHVFFPEDPINFRPIQACPSASPMLCLKIFDLSERWENWLEEIMPGLQDQLVVDGEEAIRPQDRRRNPIKHDPIFLPPRGRNTNTF